MPQPAGNYHPVQATIYRQITSKVDGEPIQTREEICKRYLRFPYLPRTGFETQVQHNIVSAGQIIIAFRRDSKTTTFDPAMVIVHDGTTYGIISPSQLLSPDRDEVQFLCQYRTMPRIVTG